MDFKHMKNLFYASVLAFLGGVGHILKVVWLDVPSVKADVVLINEKTDSNRDLLKSNDKKLDILIDDIQYIKKKMR